MLVARRGIGREELPRALPGALVPFDGVLHAPLHHVHHPQIDAGKDVPVPHVGGEMSPRLYAVPAALLEFGAMAARDAAQEVPGARDEAAALADALGRRSRG